MKKYSDFLILFVFGASLIAVAIALSGTLHTILLVAGIVLIALSIVALVYTAKSDEKLSKPFNAEYDYVAKPQLMTASEREMFDVLRSATRHAIYPQVALSALVDKKGNATSRNELFRVLDFVICNSETKPILVVELNDKSHFLPSRRERDEKVAYILGKAKIKLLVVTVDELRGDRHALISKIRTMLK